ncbi:hypothetical protein S40288_10443 [Stachybotrys chartarum IBT 40288]|nr:hypothetical protein S40288_10443 [Stachybotrys chartarum IBT 40288]
MTFSQDGGFLRSGADVNGMIRTGEMMMRYLGCVGDSVGQVPWLDAWLGKNPNCPVKFATFEGVASFAFQRVQERISSKKKRDIDDFLDNFLEAKTKYPVVNDEGIVSYTMLNLLAGADTTAIIAKATLYYVGLDASVRAKLVAELDAAHLSFPPSFEETKGLPYLNAVIKESMRMHPVINGILERVVPADGLALPDGRMIDPGTKIGINPWVLARSESIYGENADTFHPERWLQGKNESEKAYDTRMKRFSDADLTFGAGNRICVGRHMAHVEMHKIIATLFSRYDQDHIGHQL